jgi:hypothetical protein
MFRTGRRLRLSQESARRRRRGPFSHPVPLWRPVPGLPALRRRRRRDALRLQRKVPLRNPPAQPLRLRYHRRRRPQRLAHRDYVDPDDPVYIGGELFRAGYAKTVGWSIALRAKAPALRAAERAVRDA